MQWLFLVCLGAPLFSVSCAKAVTNDFVSGNQLVNNNKIISQLIDTCSESHSLKICLKMKSLMLLEDLTFKDAPIHIFGNSLTLVKSSKSRTGGRMLPATEAELDSTLPKNESAREFALDNLISSSMEKFFSSRSLQIRLTDFVGFWDRLVEGRRRKGGFGAGWAFALTGAMMGALGIGAIALMAGKALTVSMMALLLAALSAMKKGGGDGGGHASTTYEVINVPTGHGHHGYARSMARSLETGVDLPGGLFGADLAYRRQTPQNLTDEGKTK